MPRIPMLEYNEVTLPYTHSGARYELRFIETEDSVDIYTLNAHQRTAVRPATTHVLSRSIQQRDVNRVLGARERTWGRVRSWMQDYLMVPTGAYYSYAAFDFATEEVFAEALFAVVNQKWPVCDVCNVGISGGHTHTDCTSCQTTTNNEHNLQIRIENEDSSTEDGTLCNECVSNGTFARCTFCNFFVNPDTSGYVEAMGHMCIGCFDARTSYCEECELNRDSQEFWDANTCNNCADSTGISGRVHAWDYRPELIFHPETPVDPKKPLYIGIEVEVSTPDYSSYPRKYREWIGSLDSDIIYTKSDASVSNGFEVVTHPMQPRWALENLDFDKFDELIKLGARDTHSSTGTHVHMNKESLSPAHLWKMLQVHFRIPAFCKLVGGREDSTYASFSIPDVQAQRNKLMDIVKRKNKGIDDFNRYVAVNLRNEYTIELRYMRGGVQPSEIKKNIEWALALYEFTDYLTVKDVRDGALSNPGYLLWWISENDYPNLQEWIDQRNTRPIPIVRSK